MKKLLLLVALPFIFAFTFLPQGNSYDSTVETDQFKPIFINSVKLDGEMGRRIDVTINNNLLVLDADKDFLLPFEARKGFGGGYIGLGKLIDATATLAANTKDSRVIALKEHLVNHVLGHQEADGYVGLFPAPNRMGKLWDIHEVQYIAWGLLRDFELFGKQESLTGARKVADYLILNWQKLPPNWNEGGVAPHVAVTGLERTMLALHRVTGEKKYLDFVCQTRKLPEWDLPIIVGRQPGIEGHMYAYLSRTLALLELYRETGDNQLMRVPKRATDFMLNNDGLMLTGSGGQWEIWTNDQDGRGALGETCATAYQIRIYDAMLRQKGESFWGDLMERTIFNTLFAAQSPNGRQIRYFAPTEGKREYHPDDIYCCPNNYRRIIAELPAFVYYTTDKGVAVNLYTASKAELTLQKGQKLVLQQETAYPSDGKVKLKLSMTKPTKFELKLRIPGWAAETKVAVNGQNVSQQIRTGEYLPIEREWKTGDVVTLDMPMPFRLIEGRQRQAGRVAIMRGPMVYCLNPSQNEKFKGLDGIELSRIILDPSTMTLVPDSTLRPDGTACKVKGWKASFGMSVPPHQFELTLKEFPDPDGQQTYFSLSDMKPAVPDELFR
jgi:DUF1680 family protein